jgi:hypothetical protein
LADAFFAEFPGEHVYTSEFWESFGPDRYVRHFLIDVPGCIKHEYAREKRLPTEGHLVTGASAVQFHLDVLHQVEELFSDAPNSQHSPDLTALYGFRQFLVGRTALHKGQRGLALEYLGRAVKTYPGKDVAALLLLVQMVQNNMLVAAIYRAMIAAEAAPLRLWRKAKRLARIDT